MCPAKTDEQIFTVNQKKEPQFSFVHKRKLVLFSGSIETGEFFSHILRNV